MLDAMDEIVSAYILLNRAYSLINLQAFQSWTAAQVSTTELAAIEAEAIQRKDDTKSFTSQPWRGVRVAYTGWQDHWCRTLSSLLSKLDPLVFTCDACTTTLLPQVSSDISPEYNHS